MIDKIKAKLEAMGFKVNDPDPLLQMGLNTVEQNLRNSCNLSRIPKELSEIVINRTIGEYLFYKKAAGDLDGIDLEPLVKQIKVGDTTTTFDTGDSTRTPEQRLDSLISYLIKYGAEQLGRFRRIRW